MTIRTLLARQGIYDKNSMVYAYEILYRSNELNHANIDDHNPLAGDAATSSVITQLFTNLDLHAVIGNKPAFINFTYSHLIQKIPALLPKNKIVIEVLETVDIDNSLINSLKDLKNQGYRIALDDFLYKKELHPLLELADIIKLDVLHLTQDQIAQHVEILKPYSSKLLAEKIEDKQQFLQCIELGFTYFQGFFLNKPDPYKGQVLTENKLQVLRLMTELSRDDVTVGIIEEIILQMPKLSYRILRLVNSGFCYKSKRIDSLKDAICLLGFVQIRNWLHLLMLSSFDDVALDLLERTLIRAKMCECLAIATGYSNPHQAYTVGIFSTLDAILHESMPSLLSKIQLSDSLNQALLNYEGELGKLLQIVINYEKANFSQLTELSLNSKILTQSYLQGIENANQIIGVISPQMK